MGGIRTHFRACRAETDVSMLHARVSLSPLRAQPGSLHIPEDTAAPAAARKEFHRSFSGIRTLQEAESPAGVYSFAFPRSGWTLPRLRNGRGRIGGGWRDDRERDKDTPAPRKAAVPPEGPAVRSSLTCSWMCRTRWACCRGALWRRHTAHARSW